MRVRIVERLNTRHLRIALLMTVMALMLGGCPKSDVLRNLQTEAMSGDVESQYRLGMNYTNGHGVTQDYSTAANWFEKAAKEGHTGAQYMLGVAYYAGRGIGQDYSGAISWFQKAAEAGHMRAQYQLGDAYMNGRGVPKDHSWGARWYGMAAAQGHKEAQFYLGAFYSKGLGLSESKYSAVFWLTLANKNGHAHAATALDNLRETLPQSRYQAAINLADQWKPVEGLRGLNNRPTVRYIQYKLNGLGYSAGLEDGILGQKTGQAMGQYLKDKGMDPAGGLQQVVAELRKSPSVSK